MFLRLLSMLCHTALALYISLSPLMREPTSPSRPLMSQQINDVNSGAAPPSEYGNMPNNDERSQFVGAEEFHLFETRMNDVIKELLNFNHATRQLESSGSILSSSNNLRDRLTHVLHLFNANAAHNFPRKISRTVLQNTLQQRLPGKSGPSNGNGSTKKDNVSTSVQFRSNVPDTETLPIQLESLSKDVAAFLKCLTGFQEYAGDDIYTAFQSFEGDLMYWSSCLKFYAGQFRTSAIQMYLHGISMGMSEHLNIVRESLSTLIEFGVPAIRLAQTTLVLNLSTLATFFSAVTATTLQFTYAQAGETLADLVNCFWISSLVFSTSAAVNSLLGVLWKQAIHKRFPGHRVPSWIMSWMTLSPVLFLAMSVVCFSIGLCLFAYSSNQAFFTSTVTVILTALTSSGLCAISVWFVSESWKSHHKRGQKWLADALFDKSGKVKLLRYLKQQTVARMKDNIWHQCLFLYNSCRNPIGDNKDPESVPSPSNEVYPPQAAVPLCERENLSSGRSVIPFADPTASKTPPGNPEKRKLAAETVRSRQGVTTIVPKLQELDLVLDINAHNGLIRHLEFSPDGKFLATASWDGTSAIYCVRHRDVEHGAFGSRYRTLQYSIGFVGQVAWSPNGEYLLTRLRNSIKLWTLFEKNSKTFDRPTIVETIHWFPGGESFISIEGGVGFRLNINGLVEQKYDFKHINFTLLDIAVTPDGERLLGVGALVVSPSGLQPKKCKPEKQLFVYNVTTEKIEVQLPVIHDVRDITLERTQRPDGLMALVSYNCKVPPQLWKLELEKKNDNPTMISRLLLKRTYMPKTRHVDFSGPSYFGGRQQEVVISADKAGDIHFWDTESGEVVHHIGAQTDELTAMAWNHKAEDPFMLAIGSYDGKLRIWTRPESEQEGDVSAVATPISRHSQDNITVPTIFITHQSRGVHSGAKRSTKPENRHDLTHHLSQTGHSEAAPDEHGNDAGIHHQKSYSAGIARSLTNQNLRSSLLRAMVAAKDRLPEMRQLSLNTTTPSPYDENLLETTNTKQLNSHQNT